MKMNKLLSVLLSTSVALSLLSVPALAAEDVTAPVPETEFTAGNDTAGNTGATSGEERTAAEGAEDSDGNGSAGNDSTAESDAVIGGEEEPAEAPAPEAQLLGETEEAKIYPLTIVFRYSAGPLYADAPIVAQVKIQDKVTANEDYVLDFGDRLSYNGNNYAVQKVALSAGGNTHGFHPQDRLTIEGNVASFEIPNWVTTPNLDLTINLWYPTYVVNFTTEHGGTINGGTAPLTFPPKPEEYDPRKDAYGYQAGEDFPTVTLAADPGYVFAGWYRNDEPVELPQTIAAEDGFNIMGHATYTAKWTPVADVTVWHYYGADSSPVADAANGAPEMTLTRDSETLTGEFVNAFASSKDGYQFVSYEVTGVKEDDSWSNPVRELDGSLDLAEYKAVRVHLIYEIPTPSMVEVTTSIDENGTITASGEYEVGSTVTVTYAAKEGYHVTSVLVDGESVDITGSVVFESISGNHSVVVTTAANESSDGENDNGDNSDSGNNGGADNGGSNNGTPDNGSSNNGSSNNGSSNNGSSNNGGGSRPTPDTKPEPPVTPDEPEDEVVIEDEDIPLGDLPVDTEDTTVEMGDVDIPLGDLPEDVTVDETVTVEKETVSQDDMTVAEETGTVVIVGEHVPAGNLPQTGTMTASAYGARTLTLLALAASLSAAGLAVVLGRKKDGNA